jgi:hypothetical protein
MSKVQNLTVLGSGVLGGQIAWHRAYNSVIAETVSGQLTRDGKLVVCATVRAFAAVSA